MHDCLGKAAESLGIELPALEESSTLSEKVLGQFKESLKKDFSIEKLERLEETDVVLLGSIARGECTEESDCDYFILQNGAPPDTAHTLVQAAQQIREDLGRAKPGVEGAFGEIVVAPNLFESIGLNADTNTNLTRRILLLSESKHVTVGDAHAGTIDNILSRYYLDMIDSGHGEDSPAKIPRYLLNDLVRYWRTIAVDFGSKRWRRGDSQLRLAKLRISRKILFAGPLATVLLVPQKTDTIGELTGYLRKSLEAPPLAQIAKHTDSLNKQSRDAMKTLLLNYDQFIAILSGGKRAVLKGTTGDTKSEEEIKEEEIKNECREIGDNIQSSLEEIFFEDRLFKESFRKYSVF